MTTNNKNLFYSEEAIEMRKRLQKLNAELEEVSYNVFMKRREFDELRKKYEKLIGVTTEETQK